jgi:hypothetical protein
MKRLLAFAVGALAIAGLWLYPFQASASTLTDCLARQHVCVNSDSRALVSQAQEAQLQRQIGGADIYLVVAGSDPAGYNSAMTQIISTLNGHERFTVGFMDSRLMYFGAYNKGMLPARGAADIATEVMAQHQADNNVYAALTEFVTDVQKAARSGPVGATSTSSQPPTTVLIGVGVIIVLIVSGIFLVGRPVRRPASTALTRWSRASNRRYARSRCAAPGSAISIPVWPRRTGAATVSVLACSPGSCSGRRPRLATSAASAAAASRRVRHG